jgi:hypothetical protein
MIPRKKLCAPVTSRNSRWRGALRKTAGSLRRSGAFFLALILFYLLFLVVPALAGVTEPDPRAQEQFDFMNALSKKGLHDLEDERWNAYGQFTYISSWKGAFPASYTNLNGSTNSLLPGSERSFSGTATLYLGLKTWHGG